MDNKFLRNETAVENGEGPPSRARQGRARSADGLRTRASFCAHANTRIRIGSLPVVQGVHQKVMFVDKSWLTELPHAALLRSAAGMQIKQVNRA